jgi:hypothetical protein
MSIESPRPYARMSPAIMIRETGHTAVTIAALLLLAACGRSANSHSDKASALSPPSAAAAGASSDVASAPAPSIALPSGAPWGVKAGMTYAAARAQLLAHGFIPVAFTHTAKGLPTGLDAALASAYPEATFCSGTGDNLCDFVFQHRASGAYLVLETSGEVDKHPGTDLSVFGLFASATRYDRTADRTDPRGPEFDRTNLLTSTTAWQSDDGVVAAVVQATDPVEVETDAGTYTLSGQALIAAFKAKGYQAHGFSRPDSAGDTTRIDFVGATPPTAIHVYLDLHPGTVMPPTITYIDAGGETYARDALRDYLTQLTGQPLVKGQ